jgi:hypothetical protein
MVNISTMRGDRPLTIGQLIRDTMRCFRRQLVAIAA